MCVCLKRNRTNQKKHTYMTCMLVAGLALQWQGWHGRRSPGGWGGYNPPVFAKFWHNLCMATTGVVGGFFAQGEVMLSKVLFEFYPSDGSL